MREKQSELKSKNQGGNIVYLKYGSDIRARILNMGPENDFVMEVIQFYLGGEIKGVISPATFNEPCAIYEAYQEAKASNDDSMKELAKKFNIRKRYLGLHLIYKDKKGKEVDENSPKFIILTNSQYQDVLDLYLDEDEWGDMTDPKDGYDIRYKRTGSSKTDTEYSTTPCSKTPLPKEWAKKVFNLEEEVRKIIPTYEETEAILKKFLGESDDDEKEDDDEKRKKDRRARRRERRDDE